jgi:hypothetical protein
VSPRTREFWTESDLLALDPQEMDFQEFKASAFLDDGGTVSGHFAILYSKQVSAFANGAGGRLFLGIDDAGHIDGGVRTTLKSGGVRAWLEDVTPNAVEPPLRSFNVFEVLGDGRADSRIGVGHAVYVVEIPASENAPHQAMDHRYYLRIAGKSRPMGHVHVQDVLRRTLTPSVTLERIGPFGEAEADEGDARGPRVLLSVRAFLRNTGRTMAGHVGGELVLPRPLVSQVCRERTLSHSGMQITQRPGELSFFKYLPTPLFPTQELFFQRVWFTVHGGNLGLWEGGGGRLRWRVYADDAPPATGELDLSTFRAVRRAMGWVRQHPPPAGGQAGGNLPDSVPTGRDPGSEER